MTDEEKVNNYELACIADVYKDDVCTIPYAYSAQKLEQAYLDGLAEGRKEKWHDLRKNPDDLPKVNTYVLCVNRKYRYEVGCIGYVYNNEWYWHNISFNIVEPIAWCELPKFEEKKNG